MATNAPSPTTATYTLANAQSEIIETNNGAFGNLSLTNLSNTDVCEWFVKVSNEDKFHPTSGSLGPTRTQAWANFAFDSNDIIVANQTNPMKSGNLLVSYVQAE